LQQHCLFLNAHGNSLGNYPSFFWEFQPWQRTM
jgi:hypothetical protein